MFRRINCFLFLISLVLLSFYFTGLSLMEKTKNYQKENDRLLLREVRKKVKINTLRSSTVHQSSHQKVEARLEARRKNMLKSCVHYKRNLSIPMDVAFVNHPSLKASLFFSDKYKLLLCEIPKCASTNQAKFLTMAEGLLTKEESVKLPSIRATTIAHRKLSARQAKNIFQISKRMKTYTSLVIVREPFSRLLSAFRNKLENNSRSDGYSRLGNRIHRSYSVENNTQTNETSYDTNVTFAEFAKYLTNPIHLPISDPHWKFYEGLCAPCALKYNFIVHLDTLQEDMDFIVKKLNIKNTYFPPSYDSFTDHKKVEKYYNGIPSDTLNALYRTYKIDYDLFGFSTPYGV
ncbi:carbohydrate sulfotransferase 10-like [Styela clava]|uniref:carbohydrate sulfotransferase 11-like n=1 Tax=Styela clava TaxID=7725 RepID=UPI00193AD732|nr:carbohydrate sulfotransferase 11-like [Styela clava]